MQDLDGPRRNAEMDCNQIELSFLKLGSKICIWNCSINIHLYIL